MNQKLSDQNRTKNIQTKAITIVGMSDDGCLSLTARAVNAVLNAQILIGGERHLEFFPQFEGEKIPIKGKLSKLIQHIEALSHENNVVVIASGDPLFYGIGGLIVKKLGLDLVEIVPHPGSIQLAFSRLGLKWNDAKIISFHARPIKGFITKIQNHEKIGILTDSQNTPQKIAQHMLHYKEEQWQAYVCEHLGGVDENIQKLSIKELAQSDDIKDLNVLILIRDQENFQIPATIGFIDEKKFEKCIPQKRLITKKDIRLLSLGYMNLKPNAIVWDIGTASGSVAIEAAKLCPEGFVYAIETNKECISICKENVIAHKVDNVEVIAGKAPEALEGLPAPDAVFVGGSKGNMKGIIETSLKALSEGGRLVITAITLETIQETYQYFKNAGIKAEITQVNISKAVPLAHYHRYEAMNPIHIFCAIKITNEESI